MNREVTKFFPENNDIKIGRRSLLGMTLAGLAGYLFHSLSKDSAAEHMVASFAANLRAIAALVLLPGPEAPETNMKRIRALRAEIGSNFQTVMAQSDAVPFEFGLKRAEGMANRALIKSWQPRLQTVYLEELALLQHRVFGAEKHLPSAAQISQRRFNQACASLLMQMADYVDGKFCDGKFCGGWVDLDAPLAELSHSVEGNSSDDTRLTVASGLERLSKHTRDLLTELSTEIGGSHLVRTSARRCNFGYAAV
jgi:hypothetical protein